MPNKALLTRKDFTVLEKRIFLRAFAQIKQGMHVQESLFNDTIEVYFQYSDLNETNWDRVKTAVKKLQQRTIVVVDDNQDYEGWNWVTGVKAKKDEGITVRFNKDINPVLMELSEGYTKLQLGLMLTLTSEYSQSLYELLSHWHDIGKKQPFEVDYIRELLGVPGSYNLGMFRKRVLEVAKKELATKTNIQFEYELIKLRSRSFNYVQFFIKKTNVDKGRTSQLSVDFDTLDDKSRRCYDKAKSYGVNNEGDLKMIVDSKQKEFWKLNATYQTMEVKPSAGKILIDLGLRESKF